MGTLPFSIRDIVSLDTPESSASLFCVMAPALRSSDFASAEIYGVTDMGLMDLGTLRDLSDVVI